AEPHQTYCEGACGSSALIFSGHRKEHTDDSVTTPGSSWKFLPACRSFVMILGHAARSLREHGTIRSVTLQDSAFLRACRRQPVPHTPVWFMRQAGRSLPEYRKLREGVPMLEACARPDMIVEITLQPVRRYNVDAAIFFSAIMVPLKAIGVDLDIKPGVEVDADGLERDHDVAEEDQIGRAHV